ncbi:hypothetical protein HLRTI_002883, partial [Halorhabdus tiamatea SARL4B]
DGFYDTLPKQQENWEECGAPVLEELEDEDARTWYLRLRRPKKRGSGMMDRDHVKTGEPEKYLRESIDQFQRPRTTSIGGMVMSTVGVEDDEQREKLDDVAVRIVAAKINGGILGKGTASRIKANHERVAELYGASV